MSKEKRMPKEYAIVVSLMIFFAIVILVGTIRIYLVTKDRLDRVDLINIDVLEPNTNIDFSNYNIRIINSIRDTYGIDIYYGMMTELESVNAIPLTDETVVFNILKEVNSVLSKYPKDLIKEIEAKGYEISIYLVDYFTNNVQALANRNSIGQMKIYMSNTDNLQRALHHEYYHILDYYIRLEANENLLYINWDKYNPKGFKYTESIDEITAKYVYKGQAGAYFVTPYAKYSEKEDRAETFAEMMTASKDELFFVEGEPIRGKVDTIKNALSDTFRTIRREQYFVW